MFPDYDQECWKVQLKVTKEPIERVNILVCDHEEADTLLSLHIKHATKYRNQGISLVSGDTCYGSWRLQQWSKLVPTRYINISSHWSASLCCTTGIILVVIQSVRSLVILHQKLYNLTESIKLHSVDFAETWKIRLTFWRCFNNGCANFMDQIRQVISKCWEVTTLCAKRGQVELYQLPPWQHSPLNHVLCAIYQTYTWINCLPSCHVIPSPIRNDWILDLFYLFIVIINNNKQ